MVGVADPDVTQTGSMTAHEMLREASHEIGDAFAGDLSAEAEVHWRIGRAFATIGESSLAEGHLRRALELRRSNVPAQPDLEYEILWILQIVRHDTEALDRFEGRAELEKIGCSIIAKSNPDLANVLLEMHRLSEKTTFDVPAGKIEMERACRLAEQSFEPADPLWLIFGDQMESCSYSVGYRGHPGTACEYLIKARDSYLRVVPETNFRVVRTMHPLLVFMFHDKRHEEGGRLAQGSIEVMERLLPHNHWFIASMQRFVGQSLRLQGRLNEAEMALVDGIERLRRGLGEGNGHYRAMLLELLAVYEEGGKKALADQARPQLASAFANGPTPCSRFDMITRMMGDSNPDVRSSVEAVLGLTAKDPGERVSAVVHQCIMLCRDRYRLDDNIAACIADVLDQWADG